MNLIYLIVTLGIAIAFLKYFRKIEGFLPCTLTLLGIILFSQTISSPTLAALSIKDIDLPQRQQILEEDLKLVPGGNHYSGVESIQITSFYQNLISDKTIHKNIESYLKDNVVVVVVDGSVRLAGTVKDRVTAQELVNKTKAILGVREVTYNFGLENSISQSN